MLLCLQKILIFFDLLPPWANLQLLVYEVGVYQVVREQSSLLQVFETTPGLTAKLYFNVKEEMCRE